MKRSSIRSFAARTLVGGAAALALTGPAMAGLTNNPTDTCQKQIADYQDLTAEPQAQPAAADVPNIIVILVDDMGYSDIGLYGGEITTPTIDALGRDGIKFSQFYNTARCSPSRASLLTGLYPHQAGLGYLQDQSFPTSKGICARLLPRAVTIPEVLRRAGYYTAMAGKWHVGKSNTPATAQKRGFTDSLVIPSNTYYRDQSAGGEEGEGTPVGVVNGVEYPLTSTQVKGPYTGPTNWYATDLLEAWAKSAFTKAQAANKPLFLYLTYTAPHYPLMAPQSEVDAQFATYRNFGWDTLRTNRLNKQLGTNLFPANAAGDRPIQGGNLANKAPTAKTWSVVAANGAEADQYARMMAVYAAAVKHVDTSIGNILASMDAATRNNTLILFMSDNGGTAEGGTAGRLIVQPGGYAGGPDSQVFTGLNWAHLQNAPFKSYKRLVDEGGISSPLIMSWPAMMNKPGAPLKNSTITAPTHMVDIMPTLIDAAKTSYPAKWRSHDILPKQGMTLYPAFTGSSLETARSSFRNGRLFWEHEGNRAVRDGKWKAVSQCGTTTWQLYDISKDRVEKNNVAAANPNVLNDLTVAYTNWVSDTYVDKWTAAPANGSCYQP